MECQRYLQGVVRCRFVFFYNFCFVYLFFRLLAKCKINTVLKVSLKHACALKYTILVKHLFSMLMFLSFWFFQKIGPKPQMACWVQPALPPQSPSYVVRRYILAMLVIRVLCSAIRMRVRNFGVLDSWLLIISLNRRRNVHVYNALVVKW